MDSDLEKKSGKTIADGDVEEGEEAPLSKSFLFYEQQTKFA